MSDTVVSFLLLWLLLWGMLWFAYVALLFGVEWLLIRWERYRRSRRHHQAVRAELHRIDAEANESVRRVQLAFVAAARSIHDEAARSGGRR